MTPYRRLGCIAPRSVAHRVTSWAAVRVGGVRYLEPIALLAAVVSLDGADKGTLAVNARSLEHVFGVGHTSLGLLASITSLSGALFTLPVGVLTDRVVRVRLLGGSIVLWAVATGLSAAASSFTWLVVTRAALGAVTATAGPTIASLVGDFFPASRRAQLYGYILMGEILGTGIGLVMTTALSSFGSWRLSLAWPAVPAILLSWRVWRTREPPRGGGRAAAGKGDGKADDRPSEPDGGPQRPGGSGALDLPGRPAAGQGSRPRRAAVLREDPRRLPVPAAFLYVLRIPTVLIMITASSLGYFFLAGVRTFGVLFATGQYGISKAAAGALAVVVGAGAVIGLYLGGHAADRLLRAGHPNGRVVVAVVALFVSPLALAPAILASSPLVAASLLFLGGIALTATNPPLDAARLDVVPSGLWGTSESARTAVRTLGELAAPLLFGYASAHLFSAHGLRWTFLLFLAPLTAAGLVGLLALRTYPRDVATAEASERAVHGAGKP
ncbi:MFS transporter [Streptomyces sp. NPDC059168]|uniref:MFS transporter n=1 Tax=Streptomyces sp. NPDC059168 TaxID=3346753 RepID=UPI0036911B05